MSGIERRRFLWMAAAVLVRPQRAADLVKRSDMIVRSRRPEDLEMPIEGFTDFITPIDRFFVRTHVTAPSVDVSTWRLRLEGNVSSPLALSIDDLRSMPSSEVVAVLECAGNGRSFYEPPMPGLQWTDGAVGNGRWRGVRLADVLKRAGVKAGTVEILFDGADVPIGTMQDFQRSIPLEKALHPATLLAYEMNGQTLPAKHGFPLRVIVPGWAGNSWIKWVTSIRVLTEPSTGFWMKNAYLRPANPVPPGAAVSADAMIPVTSLRVKSVIFIGSPSVIRGAAWTGDGARIKNVDVSTDRGRTWKPARLTGPATPFGWRQWEFPWTLPAEGYYTLLARARVSSGDVQPVVPEWNPSGYLWNSVARVDVDAGRIRIPEPVDRPAPTPPAFFREACLRCHDDDVIRQQRLTRAQWGRELDKMIGWGARVEPADREALLDYLLSISR